MSFFVTKCKSYRIRNMKNNIIEYSTINLIRDERRNDELSRLSESQDDFEFRRLFIDEREKDLHVFFSRRIVANFFMWTLLFFTAVTLQSPALSLFLLGLSVSCKIIAYYNHRMYIKVNFIYSNSLSIVNCVIKNDYGITL